jgi:hypothetical protein
MTGAITAIKMVPISTVPISIVKFVCIATSSDMLSTFISGFDESKAAF